MKKTEIFFGILRIPVDIIMVLLAFIASYQLRLNTTTILGMKFPANLDSLPKFDEYLQFSLIATAFLLLIFGVKRMYSLKNTKKFSDEVKNIIALATFWLLAIIVYYFAVRGFPFSRLALGYAWLFTIIFISAGRLAFQGILYTLLKHGIGQKKLLFIGHNSITERLFERLHKDIHYDIAGFIDHDAKHAPKNLKSLGLIEDFAAIIRKHGIEEVIQTKTNLGHHQSNEILALCREHHIAFSFVPDLLEVQQTNIETQTIAEFPVIQFKPTPLEGWGKVIKRIFDLTGAICGIIILSPILLITAIAIKLDSKGTILFKFLDDGSRAKRVGEHGTLFNFYKFRTMYPNTHNQRYNELAENNTRKGTPVVKIKNDPRVTKVGKFLRKTSIDELPQLFNVIKGNMSLVGPRPHLPEEVEKYQGHHKFVLTIKPGITGMSQISGRSDLDFEQEVKLDTYYIEHWSIWMDIKIIFKTLSIFFKKYNE